MMAVANNGKVIAQLSSLYDLGDVMPLPACQYIAKKARSLAPVDTGYLRDHIHAMKTGKTAIVISDAPYSAFVEFGTRKMAAQPFIRPAVDEGHAEMLTLTVTEVNREIRRRVK
jgi:HK97 gp10 family phage protein